MPSCVRFEQVCVFFNEAAVHTQSNMVTKGGRRCSGRYDADDGNDTDYSMHVGSGKRTGPEGSDRRGPQPLHSASCGRLII